MKNITKNITLNILFVVVFCIVWWYITSDLIMNVFSLVFSFGLLGITENQLNYSICTFCFIAVGTICAVFMDKWWNIILTVYSSVSALNLICFFIFDSAGTDNKISEFSAALFLLNIPPFAGINTSSNTVTILIILAVCAAWSFLTLRKYFKDDSIYTPLQTSKK